MIHAHARSVIHLPSSESGSNYYSLVLFDSILISSVVCAAPAPVASSVAPSAIICCSSFSYSSLCLSSLAFCSFRKSRTGSKYGCCIASLGRMRSFLSYRSMLSSRSRAASEIMCLFRLLMKFVQGYFSNSCPFISFFTSLGIFRLYLCT